MSTFDPFKGRTGRAVVNEVAVRRMRFLHSYKGIPAAVLAQEYNIGLDACKRILKWQSWRHVSEVGPGATEADFIAAGAMQARPQASRAEQEAIEASQARLLGLLGMPPQEVSSPGLARLQAEASKLGRGDQVLEELTGPHSVSEIQLPIPANNGQQPDGGKDGNEV